MYRICINVRNLYDSNEASQDDVEGILIEERRVGLGTGRSVWLRHRQVSAIEV